MICRQKRTHPNPGPAPAIQPIPHLQPQPGEAPGEEESHQTPGSCPGYLKQTKNDATATSSPTHLFNPHQYTLTSQDTRILSGCHLPFLTSSQNAYTTTSRSPSTISGST